MPKSDGEVVLQVVDMSDSTKARREEYNKKFEEENNCKVEYTVLAGDQYQTTINSSIKANTAPDLFCSSKRCEIVDSRRRMAVYADEMIMWKTVL